MEIVNAIEDFKDSVGDKGFFIIVGGIVLLFVYNLKKQESNKNVVGENLVVASGYTSYPDVDKNANVIIDTLQNSISYSEGEIREDIAGLTDLTTGNFEATNNYINKGFEAQADLINKDFGELQGDITTAQNAIISSQNTHAQNLYETMRDVQNAVIDGRKDNYSGHIGGSTYGLNVNTSIVDNLKAQGKDSSFAARAKLAQKNGISNYTGSAEQNTELLWKIKAGKIKY